MATVHTEYFNASGSTYSPYVLDSAIDITVEPVSGHVIVNNTTFGSATGTRIHNVDSGAGNHSFDFTVLSNAAPNNNYTFVLSKTDSLDLDTAAVADYVTYNITNITYDNTSMTLSMARIGNGTGSGISAGTVYLRLFSDIADSSTVTVSSVASEIEANELITVRVTVFG